METAVTFLYVDTAFWTGLRIGLHPLSCVLKLRIARLLQVILLTREAFMPFDLVSEAHGEATLDARNLALHG